MEICTHPCHCSYNYMAGAGILLCHASFIILIIQGDSKFISLVLSCLTVPQGAEIMLPHPRHVHALTFQTCEYVTLRGQRDFADVVILRIEKWGDDARGSSWAQSHHEGPFEREAGGSSPREDVRTYKEVKKGDSKVLCRWT